MPVNQVRSARQDLPPTVEKQLPAPDAAEPLRRVRTDRFSYTLEAIGMTWLAALPLPLADVLLLTLTPAKK